MVLTALVRFPRFNQGKILPTATAGWFIALAATVAFSLAPTLARGVILAGLPPTAVLTGRMVVAFISLTSFILLTSPQKLQIDQRHGLIAIGAGLINGVGFLAFFAALSRLDASISSMIFSLSPLFVLGLLGLRGEPITQRHFIRLVLGIGGVYLLIGPGGQVDLWGVVLVLLAIISYSFSLVIVQWTLPAFSARTVTFYVNLGVTITCIASWLSLGRPWVDPGLHGWVSIFVLAIVSTFLARLLLFAGVRRLGSGQIALLSPLETLLTITWSFFLLDERLTTVQWLGGFFIFLSLILASQRIRWVRNWRNGPRL